MPMKRTVRVGLRTTQPRRLTASSATATFYLGCASLLALLTGGCAELLPLEGQPCPCAAEYYCDKSAGEPGVCQLLDSQDPASIPSLTPEPSDPLPSVFTRVFHDGQEYKALQTVGGAGMNLYRSTDGISWSLQASQIIASGLTGLWLNYYADIVKLPNGEYRAYYNATGDGCVAFTNIYLATSKDLVHWTNVGLMIEVGAPGEFDSRNMNAPSIVDDGTTFHLYYDAHATSGGDQCADGPNKWATGIGYATSADGLTWSKRGELITLGRLGDVGQTNVGSPLVTYAAGSFEMYFRASDGAGVDHIMYATSADGASWSIHGDTGLVGSPTGIVRHRTSYELFYHCAVDDSPGLCVTRRQ